MPAVTRMGGCPIYKIIIRRVAGVQVLPRAAGRWTRARCALEVTRVMHRAAVPLPRVGR
uniref:Uncharacterized protein n=1 Tax=Arundo donax TaxID=35708 RepID=A0A0A9H483_ARUDO